MGRVIDMAPYRERRQRRLSTAVYDWTQPVTASSSANVTLDALNRTIAKVKGEIVDGINASIFKHPSTQP
jgi:hypothetical protein